MTIPSWCRVGAKLICVDAAPLVDLFGRTFECKLEKGRTYTVAASDVLEGVFRSVEAIYPAVMLEEVANPKGSGFYALTRFRPLVTEQDDLEAHFNQFLTTDHRERV